MYWQPQSNGYYPNQDTYYENVPGSEYRQSLTGIWIGDDGGTYYIHQPFTGGNSPIYWLGLGSGNSYANVFIGDLRPGGIINGRWGDVPIAQNLNHGQLTLRVEANGTKLKLMQQTGGFGISNWTRQA
ncbi:hypothetical protein COF54_11430 [Bacillus toyonensis]|uniref:hypothetical protein n=1 Tax=Bacillus toyonensis TaxID=155322 RepID=UPI000BFD7EF9|nr:hypothetical protein [Bacillus toyonensis]PHD08601.1 hypothetical protein COF54_11430 [Bacillus toyonensis]